MILRLIIFIWLSSLFSGHAQKSFEFDFVAEYKIRGGINRSMVTTQYQFYNSKDNSYMLWVNDDNESIHMWLTLESGQRYYDRINREDFFVEAISLKCPKTWTKRNSDYENLKDYEVRKLPDTIINTNRYTYFVVNPLNKKEIKKKNLLPTYYIMDNTDNFKAPFLYPTGLLYRKWKKESTITNGIIKEAFVVKNGTAESEMHLVQYIATKKIILIDIDCR